MIHLEPADARHDRDRFRCGVPALDASLRRARDSGTVVAVEERLGVVGYYTLGPLAAALEPDARDPSLPRDREGEIPLALIARLARDRRVRGQRVGAVLLADALARILDQAPQCFAIVADAPTETARAFYGQFGFTCLPSQPARMWLLASTAAKARGTAPARG